MDDLHANVKAFITWVTPYIEACVGFLAAVFQFVIHAPEAVAIVSATCLLTIVVILSVLHKNAQRRKNAARAAEQYPPDEFG
jgi:ABC-type transport system involved in cytochrome bd biosynthesis fused ATPase/permease subunit